VRFKLKRTTPCTCSYPETQKNLALVGGHSDILAPLEEGATAG